MRLIDADALIELWKGCTFEGDITPIIANAPTIEPEYEELDFVQPHEKISVNLQPERTGKWICYESDNDKYEDIRCPFCKFIYTVDAYHWTDIGFTKDDLEHCPHCGARMTGGDAQ